MYLKMNFQLQIKGVISIIYVLINNRWIFFENKYYWFK